MANKTVREWLEDPTCPEPYRSIIIKESTRQKGNSALSATAFSLADSVDVAIRWSDTKQGHDYWKDIKHALQENSDYLVKRALKEGGASVPAAATDTTTTVTKDTTMKNGTYNIGKLIEKANTEIAANKAALELNKADAESRQAVIQTIKAQLKADPKMASREGCTIEAKAVTLSFSGPVATNNLAKLEAVLRTLQSLSGTDIGWNDDIGFLLGDFTEANNGAPKTVEYVVTADK